MKAWCQTCLLLDYVDAGWKCCWCGTLTLAKSDARKRMPAKDHLTVPLALRAHRLHAEGASRKAAARAIHAHTGFANLANLERALVGVWASLGLPSRSRDAAQILRWHQSPKDTLPVETSAIASRYPAMSVPEIARELGIAERTVYHRLTRAGVPRRAYAKRAA